MPPAWNDLHHFSRSEFSCPDKMAWDFLMKLDQARRLAGVPFHITSSYRHGDSGAHGQGVAVDFSDNLSGRGVSSRWRIKVVFALISVGFNRIGVYDKHIHADTSASLPQQVMWWGKSS